MISLLLGDKINSGTIEFGLDGGLAITSISNISPSETRKVLNLGFYFDIKFHDSNNLLLHTGVIVKSTMGAKNLSPYPTSDIEIDSLFSNGSVLRKLNYFNVPIMLKYKFNNFIVVEGGPQLGLLSKATDEFSVEINNNTLTYTNKVSDQYKKIDFGLVLGTGYKLLKGTGMNLGVRYYCGLMNILKDSNGAIMHNNVFYIYAGIPIGRAKM